MHPSATVLLINFTDYWDSYWILRGLLKSELFSTANDTLQNFMDELEQFGFIPNGGRIYCMQASLLDIEPSLKCVYRLGPLSASVIHTGDYLDLIQ